MYVPSQFEERRLDVMHKLITDHAFGTLVTLNAAGINADHLPFELDPSAGEFGTLRAHVARANPLWRESSTDVEALAIFEGANAYVSPSWYPSKQDDGKVVPTWNYMVVHAYGPLRVIDDPVWLKGLVGRLTDRHESGRSAQWSVADAPQDYIDKLLNAIVGIEIPVTRLIGKWKISQNRSSVDRAGVVAGLNASGGMDESAMARAISSVSISQ
jgi:transcriptional regulator